MSATTRLITDRDDMLGELQRLAPTHAAVAYVGRDWRTLLGKANRLKEIVFSPSVGTNPDAAIEIAKHLRSWSRVHLLDQLHAKVYIGPRRVMLGSANLSANAFLPGGTELFEMVTVTSDATMRRHACEAWDNYRELASRLYRSPQDKRERIEELRAVQDKVREVRDELGTRCAPTLDRFRISSEVVQLEWWDEKTEGAGEGVSDYIFTALGRRSRVRVGDWVLTWRCRQDGHPFGRSPLKWMHVTEIRRNAAPKRDVYIDKLVEVAKPMRGLEPFQLDAKVQAVFREVMATSELRPSDLMDSDYRAPSPDEVDAFLYKLKRAYQNA